jgi:type IV pilus assembly protein PilM
MATPQPGVWGIDVGQCALKALRLEVIDGQVQATAFDYIEHPKILSQPDADPDQLIREALEKFLSHNSLRGDLVAISVPGQSGLARFVKLPPVEEKKIVDIVRFEAKQQIPFNLDEVVWDYQKLGSGTVTDGFALDTEIGLFAIKRDMVNRALQQFKDVDVEVHLVQMAPLALCNFVAYDLIDKDREEGGEEKAGGKKECIVALDIGTDGSNLVITDGERIIWQRPIPLGGNHFTRALTKDLKLTFAKAEHLKRNATKSGPELKKILASIKPVLNDFVGEVQRSLGYFTNTHRDAQVQYLVGLGNAFRLPGLQRFLQEKLQLEVRKLGQLHRLSGDGVVNQTIYTENVLSFAVAYGLALQGLKLTRLQTNLLPHEIQVERLVRAKKPWAVTAAAALLLGAFGLTLSYAFEYRAVGDTQVVNAIKDEKAVMDIKKGNEAKYKAEEDKVALEQKAVESVVAGRDERFNWAELNRFINRCLPRPDGSNLRFPGAQTLYRTQKAVTASQLLRARLDGVKKVAPGKDDPDEGADDLIQVNLEAVDARYVDDLAAFWDSFKTKSGDTFRDSIKNTIRPESQKETPPEKEKGWVVELRGFTLHNKKAGFVIDTLVENLARNGIDQQTPPPAPADGAVPPAQQTPEADKAKEVKMQGPIKNLISHVLLYQATFQQADGKAGEVAPGALDSLLAGGGGGGGPGGQQGEGGSLPGKGGVAATTGGGGMAPPGMGSGSGGGGSPAASRSAWRPLSGAGGQTGGFTGQGGGFAPPGLKPPGPGNAGGMGGQADNNAPRSKHTRTDFIVLFLWREPTPSDNLMAPPDDSGGGGGAPAGPAGAPTAGGMTPPGMPPPGGR